MSAPFDIKALGEIAIRCADVGEMFRFYRDILGLKVLSGDSSSDIVFFELGEGYRGHTSVLALFARDAGRPEVHPQSVEAPVTGARSSLHHIALSVDFEAQEAARVWFEENGMEAHFQEFDWIGWRGVFVQDPEGNTVELVARDPEWAGAKAS